MTASWILVPLFGLLAGVITTIAGMGGGLVLLLVLAALLDPLTALVITAPALLLGNAHRLWLYRKALHREEALRLVLGAVPGALLGGLLATSLPPAVLSAAMLGMALLALGRALGLRPRFPDGATVPMGGLAGFITATSGGGGVIIGPYLLARGLAGTQYVGTVAAAATAIHVARLTAYGAGGSAALDDLLLGTGLAATIALGNVLGDRLRRWLGELGQVRVQRGVMVACVGLAVAGMW